MKLPVSWLKKYIDLKETPEKLAELLTMSGTAVERVETHAGESVLVLEITTNRPDCLSLLGIAKEVSAVTGRPVRFPKSPVVKAGTVPVPKIKIEARKACPRYTARVIEGLTIKPSPQDVQRLLSEAGLRPINNVVDVTNFVLMETGQPMHAFDRDKLRGDVLIVRFSKKGEKMIGIDGVEYELDDKTLVISDAERPVAIAGVMGGKLTEVTSETRNILLESACFDPALVRRAARQYKLSTESSYRFERSIDIEGVAQASLRAAALISEWAGTTGVSKLLDIYPGPKPLCRKIVLNIDAMNQSLGLEVPKAKVISILRNLGLMAKPSVKGRIAVSVQNDRRDLLQEADLYEEILRIVGFDKASSRIPSTNYGASRIDDREVKSIPAVKQFFADLGFHEILSYSLVPERALVQSGFETLSRAQRLRNPLSAEQGYLRPTLLTGMLQALVFNLHRKAADLRFFEVGNRFLDGSEETVLAIALTGDLDNHWSRKVKSSFFDLKGIAENFASTRVPGKYAWKPVAKDPAFESALMLEVNGVEAGPAGVIHTDVLKKWDINQEVFFAEWRLAPFLERVRDSAALKVRPVPKYPSVRRDTAFLVDLKISVGDLERVMHEAAAPYLQDVRLFDEYKGKNIPSGKRSLAFSLAYQKADGTFTEQEITALQERVTDALKGRFGVEFRT